MPRPRAHRHSTGGDPPGKPGARHVHLGMVVPCSAVLIREARGMTPPELHHGGVLLCLVLTKLSDDLVQLPIQGLDAVACFMLCASEGTTRATLAAPAPAS
ncbi:hypothetical protein PG984_003174 [Apiospora sp. TS-2023a]